jgi:hypothetical protein
MKHSKTLQISIMIVILCINSSFGEEIGSKKFEEATEAKCEDQCQGK